MLGNCNGTLFYEEIKIKQKQVNSYKTKTMTTHHMSQQVF